MGGSRKNRTFITWVSSKHFPIKLWTQRHTGQPLASHPGLMNHLFSYMPTWSLPALALSVVCASIPGENRTLKAWIRSPGSVPSAGMGWVTGVEPASPDSQSGVISPSYLTQSTPGRIRTDVSTLKRRVLKPLSYGGIFSFLPGGTVMETAEP